MTFSSKGEDSYIVEGKEYDLEVEEISCDPKYGSCVRIISVPSMAGLDFKTLTRAESFEILMDCTSSEKIANNILDAYPNFIEKVLTEGQESIDLSLIHGVGTAYLNAYTRNLTEKYKYYNMLQKFKEYEINITDIKQLISEYTDENSIDTALKENPYKVLISILNRSFENADKLIMSIRPELAHSELRCAYLILSVLEQSENEGDTYTDANDLYYYILNEYPIAKELEDLIVPVVQTNELFYYEEETHRVAIASTYNGECMIANLVKEKTENPHKLNIDWTKYTDVDGFKMTEEQSSLLSNVCEYDIAILSGKAGSGKTSSVKALIKLMEDNGLSYSLLAPTGAAALRLSNQTNRKASTIHRKCLKDGEINSDIIIIDEMSMVGLDVFIMLLNCVTNSNAKFVLCGDMYQLPSISKGCVFSDLIESGKVPTAELTKVFRYDTSGGAFVGENVRQGKAFFDSDRCKIKENILTISNNYKFIETNEIFEEIIKEYERLCGIYKVEDIIILSPYNVGDCGTFKLNEYIENEYNPPKPNELSLSYKRNGVNIVFRKNSRIVNTKNDYKAMPLESWEMINGSDGVLTEEDVPLTQLFNGQIGVVRDVQEKYLVCQFDEELIVIPKSKLDTLLLARAISTHRSQGGEWKAVINVVSEQHERLLSKQLLYVSDTRAKEKHCDIGSKKAFNNSLLIDVVQKRNTFLKELIEREFENEDN
jgi:exodeoxyribonuclease V alpha subunit